MALSGHIVILKRSGNSGYVCDWYADKCVFGSDSSCDVYIKLSDVDPFHCKLEKMEDGRVFFINIANSAKTLLNGVAVSGRIFVPHNSVLTIVNRSFQFLYPNNSSWRFQETDCSRNKSAQASPLLSSPRLVTDVSKLPAVMSSSPRRIRSQIPRLRTPTISTQRMALSTRERYGPTPTRTVTSSPAVSVKICTPNRRSYLTKRSPSLDALAGPARKKVKVNVFCETPTLSGVQYITRLRKSNSYEDSLQTNNFASSYRVNSSANLSGTNFTNSPTHNVVKRGVQFGPRLSPERFDSRLPPSTPIKRGELPFPSINSRKGVSIVKGRLAYTSSPVLSRQSPHSNDVLLRTPKLINSSALSQERIAVRESLGHSRTVITPISSAVRKLVKAPKLASGAQKLVTSPKSLHSPGLSTAKKFARMPDAVPSPRRSGVRKLVETSKTQASPRFVCIGELLKTPNSLSSPNIYGIQKLLKTPKCSPSQKLMGAREMFRTPKSLPSSSLDGVRKLVKTPKSLPSLRLSGIRKLVKTPKRQSLPRLAGIREMLRTPESLSSPRVSGIRGLMNISSFILENSTPPRLNFKGKALKGGVEMTTIRVDSKKSEAGEPIEDSNLDVMPFRVTRGRRNVPNAVDATSSSSTKNTNVSASSANKVGRTRVGLRVLRKRKLSVSSVSHDVEETADAKPPSPKILRRTRRQMASEVEREATKMIKKVQSSKSRATATRTRGTVKTSALPPLKESRISASIEKTCTKGMTKKATANVLATTIASTTRRTRRVISADPKMSSPVVKVGRSTRRVRFNGSVGETNSEEEEVSRKAPVRRTRAKAVKASTPKLSAKESAAKSLKSAVSEIEERKFKTSRPLRRGRCKM